MILVLRIVFCQQLCSIAVSMAVVDTADTASRGRDCHKEVDNDTIEEISSRC